MFYPFRFHLSPSHSMQPSIVVLSSVRGIWGYFFWGKKRSVRSTCYYRTVWARRLPYILIYFIVWTESPERNAGRVKECTDRPLTIFDKICVPYGVRHQQHSSLISYVRVFVCVSCSVLMDFGYYVCVFMHGSIMLRFFFLLDERFYLYSRLTHRKWALTAVAELIGHLSRFHCLLHISHVFFCVCVCVLTLQFVCFFL